MRGADWQGNEGKNAAWGEKGGTQRILVLVLLLVVVVFGYIYFFTGLIQPHDEAAKAPAAETPVVKKPIPPRTEKPSEKGAPPVSASSKPKADKQEAAKAAEQPKAAAPATPQPPKKAEEAPKKEATTPRQAPSPAAPVAAVKPKEEPAAKPAEKPATAASKPAAEQKGGAQATTSVKYNLLVGDIVLDSEVKKVEGKLKKAGIAVIAVKKEKKTEPMHRLHVADFATRNEAELELKKLVKHTPAAFILPEKGKHVLYAGSYFQEGPAAKEKERLSGKAGKEYKITVQKAEVKIPVKQVVAGSFASKENAVKEADRLAKSGLKATVITARK